jgi:hypothetical protein
VTYTDPAGYTFVGAAVDGAPLDTYALDNVQYLAQTKPFCSVTRTTDYAIAGSGSYEEVTLDSTIWDSTGTMADGVGIEIPEQRWYIVQVSGWFETGTYNRNLQAVDNTGKVLCESNLFGILTDTDAHLTATSHPVLLNAGQTVRMRAYRDGADTKSITYRSQDSPVLSVRFYAYYD